MKTTKRLLPIFLVMIAVLVTFSGCSKVEPKTTYTLKDDLVSIYTTGECYVRVTIEVATGESFEKNVKVSPDAVTMVGIDDIIPSSYSRYLKETQNASIASVSIKRISYEDRNISFLILAVVVGIEAVVILLAVVWISKKLKPKKKKEEENSNNTKSTTKKK